MLLLSLGEGAFQRSVVQVIDRSGQAWSRIPDVRSFRPVDGFLVTDLTPDPVAALDHLCAVFSDAVASGVLLLVDPADATTLRMLLLRAAGIPLLEVLVKGRADSQDIEATLRKLTDRVTLGV